MEPIKPALRVNLTAERLRKGLSVEAAAAAADVSRPTLMKAERGVMPQPRLAKRIADFYGCQVTDVWPVESLGQVA